MGWRRIWLSANGSIEQKMLGVREKENRENGELYEIPRAEVVCMRCIKMNDTIIVALLSLAGTLLGSIFGILTANKLTNYRIEQLERKVEQHNRVVERVYKLERHEAVVDEEIKVANHRINDLECFHK